MERRGSGILLHITSLPSPYGIGDLGSGAYRFADFLEESRQSFWQILPLNPTSLVYGNSPYSSYSAFAGNSLLISPERMIEDGILSKPDVKDRVSFPEGRVNYRVVMKFKERILDKAYERNKKALGINPGFVKFCSDNTSWLDDYSLFFALKQHFYKVDWSKWPVGLRDRNKDEMSRWQEKLEEDIVKEKFFQFLFFHQWFALKN